MSLVLPIIFWIAQAVAITLGLVITVYTILGLLLIRDFRKARRQPKGTQLRFQFLYEVAVTPSELVLENPTTLECPRHLERQVLHLAVEGARQQS